MEKGKSRLIRKQGVSGRETVVGSWVGWEERPREDRALCQRRRKATGSVEEKKREEEVDLE
jgi:hypothetical protein